MYLVEFTKKFGDRSKLTGIEFTDKIICRSPEQAEETAEKLREPKRYGVRGERYTIENVKVISEREENGIY